MRLVVDVCVDVSTFWPLSKKAPTVHITRDAFFVSDIKKSYKRGAYFAEIVEIADLATRVLVVADKTAISNP